MFEWGLCPCILLTLINKSLTTIFFILKIVSLKNLFLLQFIVKILVLVFLHLNNLMAKIFPVPEVFY